jgi:hypothetical protein
MSAFFTVTSDRNKLFAIILKNFKLFKTLCTFQILYDYFNYKLFLIQTFKSGIKIFICML